MIRILASAALALTLTGAAAPRENPQDAFMAQLMTLCGKAFAGKVVSTDAADSDMATQPLVMHVAQCREGEVRIPFQVGADRSRTWVITRTAKGLRLKHDHRHADGHPDKVTMYGGDTLTQGAKARQDFPVDEESIAMFRANGLERSVTNVWTVEVNQHYFAYELRREGRFFRVQFEFIDAVPAPPPAW